VKVATPATGMSSENKIVGIPSTVAAAGEVKAAFIFCFPSPGKYIRFLLYQVVVKMNEYSFINKEIPSRQVKFPFSAQILKRPPPVKRRHL
jgi:hypothetical protein